jgi:hypothetical protein
VGWLGRDGYESPQVVHNREGERVGGFVHIEERKGGRKREGGGLGHSLVLVCQVESSSVWYQSELCLLDTVRQPGHSFTDFKTCTGFISSEL